jgi:hypothetical protein
MAISDRTEFIAYCMRRLGSPVINIEVDNDQVDDRVDDAIDFWCRNHMDGSERGFYIHELTQEDIDTKEITVPDDVYEVHKVMPGMSLAGGIFSAQHQSLSSDYRRIRSIDTVSYYIRSAYWDYVNDLLVDGQSISFNRYGKRVRLDISMSRYKVGDNIAFDVQWLNNPEDYPEAWNDEILKRYATAQIKRQWAENVKKFSGISLPGNVNIKGDELYSEAIQEINDLEGEMRERYSLPAMFMMG